MSLLFHLYDDDKITTHNTNRGKLAVVSVIVVPS